MPAQAIENNPSTPPEDIRQLYAEGWVIQYRGEASEPVSLHELTRLYRTGELTAADLVWHERAGRWLAMRDVLRVLGASAQKGAKRAIELDQGLLMHLQRGRTGAIRNALYLVSTVCSAILFFWIAISLMSDSDSGFLTLLFVFLDAALWWWAWLEFKGVSLEDRRMTFPVRLPFWPAAIPWRMRTLELADIDHTKLSSGGNLTHFIDLHGEGQPVRLTFDTAPARDMVALFLSLRQVPLGK